MEEEAKILIIDNDVEFMKDLQAALENKFYLPLVANNMVQAQGMVRHEKPDLIILGRILPCDDEFRLYEWLKKNIDFKHIPLIVIDHPVEKQLTKGWGMNGELWHDAENYFCRPIEPSALVPIIEKLLDRTTRKTKVLVADDHTLIRQAIHRVVNLQKDMYVVGEAANGKEAVEKTRQLMPDVVLMDIVMPGMNGLEATKRICEECPQVKVLILSQYDDEENTNAAYRMGALDFIAKKSAGSELIGRIRAASKLEPIKYSESTKKIKVLVVDDHGVVREGIHALVSLQRDMYVVGEAANGKEAVEKTRQLLPDVVLMDIVMPGMNGLEATKQICEEYQQVKVLMLTQYSDDENVHAASQAGACGFIHKRCAGSEVAAGIRAASRGEHFDNFTSV